MLKENRFTTIPSGDINPCYNNVPMDLNISPLQDYFEQARLKNIETNTTAASASLYTNGKTMPVLIPGSSVSIISHGKKKRRNKRRRNPVAQTFPDDGLTAVMERRQQQQP